MIGWKVMVIEFIVIMMGTICNVSHASVWNTEGHRHLLHRQGIQVQQENTCGSTEFLSRTKGCMQCHPKCTSGGCIDFFGCVSCEPGYFTIQPDTDWPFKCKQCTVPGCAHCEEAQLEGTGDRCAECIDGFEPAGNYTRCEIAAQGTAELQEVAASNRIETRTESTSVSQRVSSEAQVVVSDATTSTRAASLFTSTNLDEIITAPNKIGGELVCPSGFILRELDLNCEQCDSVCLPGACIKFVGCNQCPPGYFTSRRDNQFPFKCRLCDIPHCTQCRSGIIDGLPPRCIKCKDGYVEIDDGLQCIGIAAQGVSTGPNASSPAPTDPIPICKLNQFLGADGACYLCSVHCASGNCIPGEGCSKCRNGYFRRKVRAVGFFTCQKCEAAGCDECKEDVLGTGLPQCKTCSPGYSPGLQEGSCSASNGLASAFGTQSRSASTTLSAAISQRTESINVQSEKSQTKTLITRGISTSREDDTLSNDVDPIPAQTGGKSTENFTIEDLQKSITSTTSTSAASVLTDRAVNHTSDGQTSQCGNNEFSFRNLEGESICRLCNIDLCESCVDNPDTATIQCSRCHAGHSLSKDRDACLQIPQDSERSEKVIGRSSEAAITDLTQTRTARVQSEELSCSDGYFVKACNSEHTCTPCDAHCMANQCIDIFGCLRCESGYTLITVKESFVLSCSPCEITDCQECLDGGAQSSAQMCSTCRPGYNLTADRSQCIDIKDEDQHESSRESMPDSIDTNFLDYIEDDMTKNEDPGAPWPSDSEDSIPVAAPNEESP